MSVYFHNFIVVYLLNILWNLYVIVLLSNMERLSHPENVGSLKFHKTFLLKFCLHIYTHYVLIIRFEIMGEEEIALRWLFTNVSHVVGQLDDI